MFEEIVAFIKNKKSNFILGAIVIILLLAYYAYKEQEDTFSQKDDFLTSTEESSDKQTIESPIIVHISGEVKNPGMVELHYGQRLYEALEMVGGTTLEADLDKVNLALVLEDQQKIVVPEKLDEGQAASGAIQDDTVNINTANLQELTTLPGIGQTIAQNIIDHREDSGGFTNIEQIKEVPRIGNATFEKLKEKITCY